MYMSNKELQDMEKLDKLRKASLDYYYDNREAVLERKRLKYSVGRKLRLQKLIEKYQKIVKEL